MGIFRHVCQEKQQKEIERLQICRKWILVNLGKLRPSRGAAAGRFLAGCTSAQAARRARNHPQQQLQQAESAAEVPLPSSPTGSLREI